MYIIMRFISTLFFIIFLKIFGEPSRGLFFIICIASAVQSAVCMRVDTAGPFLVWDYMTGL